MSFWKRAKRSWKDGGILGRIHGQPVRYAARREEDDTGTVVETVLGKDGRINVNEEDLVVMCNGHEVFRCRAQEASCSELLSLDGVVIKGINACTGLEDTVVAYYKYYR